MDQTKLIKMMIALNMNFSWLLGILAGLNIVFFPYAGEDSLFQAWAEMIFYFGNGLVLQYVLLHFFNEDEQKTRTK